MSTAASRVTVRVPASSANLGPGFDCFAAALDLHLELTVERAAAFSLETDLDVPRDRSNLAVAAFERVAPADGRRFVMRSEIPLSGGLGSSAAATVAGLIAARELTGAEVDVFALASAIEGHADNVAAALAGGVALCGGDDVARVAMPGEVEAVLVIPHEPVATSRARAALPRSVPIEDAVFNTAHAALLVLGLTRGDVGLIARGLRDRLHQPYRAQLYPRSAALVEQAPTFGALGATISGAGPTVLVWCERGTGEAVAAALTEQAGDWARVLAVAFSRDGASARTG
jgi:homoserine kinase